MRVILVSNRLPVTISTDASGGISFTPSSGGLATALGSVHGPGKSLWIGWPGKTSNISNEDIDSLLAPLACKSVSLSEAEVDGFYNRFCNGTLWPLCHYLLDKVQMESQKDWDMYKTVNERFATKIVECWRPGDVIWVHDYQLMLVPLLVRERCPNATIGFFLHIPFPATEVFRILPWRGPLLRGLLGADVVGFHTASYAFHFNYSCSALLGAESSGDKLKWDGRTVLVGAFPIGIDSETFTERASLPEVKSMIAHIKEEAKNRKILLCVDRLDYTKGFLRRLLALEVLLERRADLRETIHVIQVAVPSREEVDEYAKFRSAVNEVVGRVNGKFASPTRNIVHFMYKSVSSVELSALYSVADVMLVTPLRDGMNLVAKEYIATHAADLRGVLVLSEFAGCASQLGEALLVNPYDIHETSAIIERSLSMTEEEQRQRMMVLSERVKNTDVNWWAKSFLDSLNAHAHLAKCLVDLPLFDVIVDAIASKELVILLDYDGTLVDFFNNPNDARPDKELINLMQSLIARQGTHVHIISGRDKRSLEKLTLPFGSLDLHAEHGLFSKRAGSTEWIQRSSLPPSWYGTVKTIMQQIVLTTEGSLLEEKAGSLAFHYRRCEPSIAEIRVEKLMRALIQLNPSEMCFEILSGNKVLEVRIMGVNKGVVMSDVLADVPSDTKVLCIGDDKTDEYMFKALPQKRGISIHVGSGETGAMFRVPHTGAVRALLKNIALGTPTPNFKKK